MIWVNMDSTLETLAPEVGWVIKGEAIWREKDMSGEKRDEGGGDSDAEYSF
jgi:hypothetical protein